MAVFFWLFEGYEYPKMKINGGLSKSTGMKFDNSLKTFIKSEANTNISNICIRFVPPF